MRRPRYKKRPFTWFRMQRSSWITSEYACFEKAILKTVTNALGVNKKYLSITNTKGAL